MEPPFPRDLPARPVGSRARQDRKPWGCRADRGALVGTGAGAGEGHRARGRPETETETERAGSAPHGPEWRLLPRRPPPLRTPPINGGRRVRVDGVDREGLLLRLRAEEGERRAHFLRSDPGAGRVSAKIAEPDRGAVR